MILCIKNVYSQQISQTTHYSFLPAPGLYALFSYHGPLWHGPACFSGRPLPMSLFYPCPLSIVPFLSLSLSPATVPISIYFPFPVLSRSISLSISPVPVSNHLSSLSYLDPASFPVTDPIQFSCHYVPCPCPSPKLPLRHYCLVPPPLSAYSLPTTSSSKPCPLSVFCDFPCDKLKFSLVLQPFFCPCPLSALYSTYPCPVCTPFSLS